MPNLAGRREPTAKPAKTPDKRKALFTRRLATIGKVGIRKASVCVKTSADKGFLAFRF
jgi:hypothetical protein